MLTEKTKEILKKNWGERAETLNCYAEAKLIDPLSSWCCYVFAMDENEELVNCLLYSDAMGIEIATLVWKNIHLLYNEHGESPVLDTEFRRMRVTELLTRLK